jgi:hypothetical protein
VREDRDKFYESVAEKIRLMEVNTEVFLRIDIADGDRVACKHRRAREEPKSSIAFKGYGNGIACL